MALLSNNVLTLADWAKRLDPDGSVPVIVEMLEQTNEILLDMMWRETNQTTTHRLTMRTGLPTVYWRLINQSTPVSKSTTAQVDEATAMMDAWSEVDVKLAKLENNIDEFRMSEGFAFVEAMNQEKASTLMYGTPAAPEEFVGFSPRYSSLSADNAQNILDAGGTGSDNSSIWLVVWGERTAFGIYPKGSKAGLDHFDYQQQTVETGVGGSQQSTAGRLRVFQEQWTWDCGLALKDWRYVVRIANIDISDLVAGSGADLTTFMIKAMHRIPNIRNGRAAFYMNRSCFQYLDLQRLTAIKAGGGLTWDTVDGKIIPRFRQVPVRIVDALTEAEARVV